MKVQLAGLVAKASHPSAHTAMQVAAPGTAAVSAAVESAVGKVPSPPMALEEDRRASCSSTRVVPPRFFLALEEEGERVTEVDWAKLHLTTKKARDARLRSMSQRIQTTMDTMREQRLEGCPMRLSSTLIGSPHPQLSRKE